MSVPTPARSVAVPAAAQADDIHQRAADRDRAPGEREHLAAHAPGGGETRETTACRLASRCRRVAD